MLILCHYLCLISSTALLAGWVERHVDVDVTLGSILYE